MSVSSPDTRMSLRVDADGIVWLTWAPGVRIDDGLARVAMRAVDELNGPARRPLCVDISGTATVTREGRKRFTEDCSASRIALLGRSAVDRTVANFILLVSPLPVPTRFFTAEVDAAAWLRGGTVEPSDGAPERPR